MKRANGIEAAPNIPLAFIRKNRLRQASPRRFFVMAALHHDNADGRNPYGSRFLNRKARRNFEAPRYS
jgi:hypothetical protein